MATLSQFDRNMFIEALTKPGVLKDVVPKEVAHIGSSYPLDSIEAVERYTKELRDKEILKIESTQQSTEQNNIGD